MFVAADAFFKAAISRIPEVPNTLDSEGKVRSSEPVLLEFISNFVSTLLVTPVSCDMYFCAHLLVP